MRAGVVIGSYARHEQPADQWSDLDVVLITNNPDIYLATTDWLADFGEPWLTFLENTAVGELVERRALFADGLHVDFIVVPFGLFQHMVTVNMPTEVMAVFQRSIRVLFDKDGVAAHLA
jgi:aminoglycoside 6-adenylyltransferase